MFDKFCDYMYYLLTSPFKQVRKRINQWYILFRVLGKRFDEAMEQLYDAREQTMLATCDPVMLPVHAEDRKMTKYPGEDAENFRARIANYPEVLRLGGSDPGVILAARTLGYTDVEIVQANKMPHSVCPKKGDRWAEFYVIITMNIGEGHPVSLSVLRNEVRKVKYITAKDNYYFKYKMINREPHHTQMRMAYKIRTHYWEVRLLDGTLKLDGSTKLDSKRTTNRVKATYNIEIKNRQEINVIIGGKTA